MKMWEIVDTGLKKSTRRKEMNPKTKNIEKAASKLQCLGRKNKREKLNIKTQERQGKTFPSRKMLAVEDNPNLDFVRRLTQGKVAKTVKKIELESEENLKLERTEVNKKERNLKIWKENKVKNRRKLFEDSETKVEEFLWKKEPTHLKKWQDLEKGKEREEISLQEKGTKLAKIFRKKEHLKKLAKSGELTSRGYFTAIKTRSDQ